MKIKFMKQIAFATCVLFLTACNDTGTATTERGDTTATGRSGVENRGEDFISDVLELNAEEMAWLREGRNKATDQKLKTMAGEMMREHEQLETELKGYAEKRNLRIDDIDTSETARLNEKPGDEWDEEWADEVGDRHRQLIKRFERAQKRIDDTELKDIITRNLPSLRSHLDSVRNLEARLDRSNLNPNYNVDPIIK
jgi:putative membrane protein